MIGAARRWLADGLLRGVFLNAGLLLRGHVVAALMSLAYVALTARALGPREFGILVLIHTYVLTIEELAEFQSWQTIVRFGSRCLQDGRHAALGDLARFTTVLDACGAVAGAALAALLAATAAPWFGWGDEFTTRVQLYSLLVLFACDPTAVGILRLYGRFDLLGRQVGLRSGVRLLAAGIAYLAGAGIDGFMVAWFVSAAAGHVIMLVLGWREIARRELPGGLHWSFAGVTEAHPGLWRFVWATKLHAALQLVPGNVTTLVVGGMLGPTPAALFKVARDFSSVLARPLEMLSGSIYPDLSRLVAGRDVTAARRLVLRTGFITGGAMVGVVVVVAVLGTPLLRATVGEAYLGAYGVLVLLTLAAAVNGFGFSLDPAMYALGQPGALARLGMVTIGLYVVLLYGLTRGFGLVGVGLAVLLHTVVTVAALAAMVARGLAGRATRRAD